MIRRVFIRLLIPFLALLPGACSSIYYDAMESFGLEKRDLLKRAVKASRNEQKEAGEQFQSALEELRALSGFHGGGLEVAYNRFKGEYEDCEAQVNAVRERIGKMDTVARDLFREWEGEIREYSDPSLARDSRAKLADTRARYERLSAALHQSEKSMKPVLKRFHDQVLYLKHNLNAAAIGSLNVTADSIEGDLQRLVAQMEASIRAADQFMQTL